jgi:hypothetical protein
LLDVLGVEAGKNEVLVRVAVDGAVRFQSALTLFGEYDSRACTCLVQRTSSFLADLAVDSRRETAKLVGGGSSGPRS